MRRLGFTLIELLVVVGVVLILIAMLIPVIGLIRRQARDAICRNNLQQIGIGITAFQQQNNNYFPATFASMFQDGQPLASESRKTLLCPHDPKKGADPLMGRPNDARWGNLAELYDATSASSYLFEAANVQMVQPIAQNWSFYSGGPEWSADGRRTWSDAKAFQLKKGNLGDPFRPGDFPIIRCFWHHPWTGNDIKQQTKKVQNLAWDMSVFWGIPYWEHQANPAIPLPN